MMLLVSSSAVLAQQTGTNKPLPDAPSATSAEQASAKPQQNSGGFVNLLAGRSKMFPTLAVNTKPLTPPQKLELAARNSISLYTVVGSGIAAGISQARDTYTGYGQGAEGYFKRFGASMAFAATNNMLGTFAIASMLHEDPRYFVLNSPSFKKSLGYAVTRVAVTRMDDGRDGVNFAGLLAPLGASAVMNTYVPADSQGVGPTFSRWGVALAISAGTNLLREYWPRINKRLKLPNMGIAPDVAPSEPAPTTPPPPKPQ